MDASNALRFLTTRANNETAAAETARQNLARACEVKGFSSLPHLMEAVMVADANAKPWHDLFMRIEDHGVREGLAEMRTKATEALVSYGIALSTSLVVNAERIHEQDGLRRFLSATNGMDIEDDAQAEEAAPEPEEPAKAAPAPAPASKDTSKVTPAQARTLEAIRVRDVRFLTYSGSSVVRIAADGEERPPRKDMVEFAIEQGWAIKDSSTSLERGQKVTLTEAGFAVLVTA